MYDELERAAGARSSAGMSLLGWLGVGVVFLGLVGTAGAFLAVRFVDRQIEQVAEQFDSWVEAPASIDGEALLASTVSRTLGELNALPEMGEPARTAAVRRALSNSGPALPRQASGQPDDGAVAGTFRLMIGESTISADLHADDETGSLVVRNDEGQTLLDLSAHPEGGRLLIGPGGEVARIEAGPGSVSTPNWLPAPDGRRTDLERVVSGRAGAADFGSVTWTSNADPVRLIADYRSALEADGWRIESEHELAEGTDGSASLVAHMDERVIVFAAGTDGGDTRVVLGWGAGDSGR